MNSVVDCSELFASILSFLPLHYWYSYKSICKKWFHISQTTNTFKKKKQEVEDHRTEFRYIKSFDWKGHKNVICCFDEHNNLYVLENAYLKFKMYMMNINSHKFESCISCFKYTEVKQAIARNKYVVFLDHEGDLFVIDTQKDGMVPKQIQSMPKIRSIGVDETHFYFENLNGTVCSTPKNSIFNLHAEGTRCLFKHEKLYVFAIHDDYVIQGYRQQLSFYNKDTIIQKDPLFRLHLGMEIQNIQVSNNLMFILSVKSFPMDVYEITKGKQQVFMNDSHFPWTEFCVSKDYLLMWRYDEKDDKICFDWYRMV